MGKGVSETKVVKLQIPAGQAKPAPPIGPVLGQAGINIMDFCKQFNRKTEEFEKGLILPVVITINAKKEFKFIIKTPPAARLILKELGLKKGSSNPGTESAGSITLEQLENVAKIKEPDITASNLANAVRTIAGTARSMGLEVVGLDKAKNNVVGDENDS